MDGDMQDAPEDIPKLIGKIKEGYDVVYGYKERKNYNWLRDLASGSFQWAIKLLSDHQFHYNTSMFRAMSRKIVNELVKFGEKEPSLTGVIGIIGYPTSQVTVRSNDRKRGKTKYNYFKLMNFAITSILAFSNKPIRIISIIGLLVALLSFIYFCTVLAQTLVFKSVIMGWPTIVSLITFLSGMQLFALGIIGEYIGKIFIETKNRPKYIIEEIVGEIK